MTILTAANPASRFLGLREKARSNGIRPRARSHDCKVMWQGGALERYELKQNSTSWNKTVQVVIKRYKLWQCAPRDWISLTISFTSYLIVILPLDNCLIMDRFLKRWFDPPITSQQLSSLKWTWRAELRSHEFGIEEIHRIILDICRTIFAQFVKIHRTFTAQFDKFRRTWPHNLLFSASAVPHNLRFFTALKCCLW